MERSFESESERIRDIVEINPANLVIGASVGILVANAVVLLMSPEAYRVTTSVVASGVGGQFGASMAESAALLAKETRTGLESLKGRFRFSS